MDINSSAPFSAAFQERYRIERVLGRGGFGEVYLATQLALDRRVAIKTLRALEPAALERFRVEGKLLSRLAHPRIVAVHDAGEDGAVPYLVCEFVEGTTLGALLANGPLEVPRALALTIGVLEGLGAAHALGIHHRDIKPENIFVTAAGEVKIGDFGLAGLHVNPDQKLTRSGIAMGTPAYMSPEQAGGQKVDARTDLYSTGVMLYQLVTGRLPFTGESPLDVMIQQVQAQPPPPRNHRPDLSRRLEDAILKAMRKDREERFPDAAAFAAELAAVLKPAPTPETVQSPASRPVPRPETVRVPAPASAPAAVPPGPGDPPTWPRWALPASLGAGALAVALIVRALDGGCDTAPRPLPAALTAVGPQLYEHRIDGSRMVKVPGGSFMLRDGDRACTPEFYIDRCEITRVQFARFLTGAHPRLDGPAGRTDPRVLASVDPALPVTGVTWRDAAGYAAWAGRTLPSELQWVKAARGVGDARAYPWGSNDPGETRAVFRAPHPLPAGERPDGTSPFGALDMAGNVGEWCRDAMKDVPEQRAVRGGSFASMDPRQIAISATIGLGENDSSPAVGFRTVLEP